MHQIQMLPSRKNLGVFVLVLTMLCGVLTSFTQTTDTLTMGKLKLEAPASFNARIKNSRLIVTGENHHYITLNRTVELAFLRLLHDECQVNDYVIEQGYSTGILINNYIRGDTSYRKILHCLTSYPYFLLFDSIRIFNHDLPVGKQISVHGIDIEREISAPVYLLDKLLPTVLPEDDSLLLEIETIKSLAARHYYLFDSINYFYDPEYTYEYGGRSGAIYNDRYYSYDEKPLKEILKSFKTKKKSYEMYLKGDFTEFEKIMNSIEQYLRME